METEKIDVPKFDGFECIGFVISSNHSPCMVLTEDSNGNLCLADASAFTTIRRICYRKIKPKRITFEFTGEVRPPKLGEFYRPHKCRPIILESRWENEGHYEIYRIVEDQS